VRFVHPLRVRRFRVLTLALLALWSILASMAVAPRRAPATRGRAAVCLIAVYFIAVGLLPSRREPT
jgi:phosphatidylcholine synthase